MMPDPVPDQRAQRFGKQFRRVALFISCALFVCGATRPAIAQYRCDILNTDNGLPQNSIYSILQTRDGYLWFATLDGLVRYNGAQYAIFNKANSKGINSNRFRYLYEDRDGSLWIATEDGGLTHYVGGKFTTYTVADGLPDNFVTGVRRTQDGTLLAVTNTGSARLAGDRFAAITTDKTDPDFDLGLAGPSGTTWQRVGARLRRIRDGQVSDSTVPERLPQSHHNQLYEDRQGRLWIGTAAKGELLMLKEGALTRYGVKDGLPAAPIEVFCEDHEGTMWFGGDGGLTRFKDGRFATYTTAHGLSSNKIKSIYEDHEGTLWAGTFDNGITRVTRQIITTYSEKDGMTGRVFYPLLEDRAGNVWIGGDGVNRFKDGKFIYYPLNLAPPATALKSALVVVQAFYEDAQGRLWIGHQKGVYRFENEQFTDDPHMTALGQPFAIYQDRGGAFWLGSDEALVRYKDGQTQRFGRGDGLFSYVQPIYEDRQGRIWIGSYGGLAQYVDGHLVFLTERDGLSSNRVRAIYEDADGVLWIGTYDGGLNRFKDGRFTRYTMQEGLFSNGVFAILEDAHGNFWMSSNQGIYRVRKQQLNDFAEGRVAKIDSVSYGKADGMLSTECNGARHPSAIRTRDGRFWFPTFNGVAVVDPEAVAFNTVPPPVVIEGIALDRNAQDVNAPLVITPGKDDLEIRYAGLSFIKPEHMKFKYKLEGLDKDWVDAGNRRAAYYTHLPAGDYTFRVMAANSDGVWNETEAQIRITVVPPFYRTWWFLLLAGLSVAGLAVVFYRARVKQLRRTQAQQETYSRRLIDSQEQERKRLAVELHDSLEQSLVIIRNRALVSLTKPEDHLQAMAQMEEISEAAWQAILEVKEIAYNLHPYQLDRLGLGAALKTMLKAVAAASDMQITYQIDELDGTLSKEAEINLYRIVQESLNNIIKHAAATTASVSLRKDAHGIHLLIEDNGRGFTIEAVAAEAGGLGLTGIRERAKLLGAKPDIRSVPGKGTAISIELGVKE